MYSWIKPDTEEQRTEFNRRIKLARRWKRHALRELEHLPTFDEHETWEKAMDCSAKRFEEQYGFSPWLWASDKLDYLKK